jgi:hypothetical protein
MCSTNWNEHANVATFTCIDARDIEAPPPVTFEMEKVPIVTAKGKELNLVVSKEVTATKEGSKEDQDLEGMEFQLESMLGNQATFTAWLEQMWKVHKVGKDDQDKKGWSKRSFARKLDMLKNAGRVTGGGNQGDLYSVAHTEVAERARHTTGEANHRDTTGAVETGAAEIGASKVVPCHPFKGDGTGGTAFDARQAVPNRCHGTSGTASRSDCRNDETTQSPGMVPSDDELIRVAMEAAAKRRGRAQ